MLGQKNRGWGGGGGRNTLTTGFMTNMLKRRKQSKEHFKRFQKSKKTGKRMLAKEKNTSKEGNRV